MENSDTNINMQILREKTMELDQIADAVAGLSGGLLADCSENLRNAWKGESGEMMLRRCEALKAHMNATARGLRDLSAELRSSTAGGYNR